MFWIGPGKCHGSEVYTIYSWVYCKIYRVHEIISYRHIMAHHGFLPHYDTYWYIQFYPSIYLCILVHTRTYWYILSYTGIYQDIRTRIYQDIRTYTTSTKYLLVHTRMYSMYLYIYDWISHPGTLTGTFTGTFFSGLVLFLKSNAIVYLEMYFFLESNATEISRYTQTILFLGFHQVVRFQEDLR